MDKASKCRCLLSKPVLTGEDARHLLERLLDLEMPASLWSIEFQQALWDRIQWRPIWGDNEIPQSSFDRLVYKFHKADLPEDLREHIQRRLRELAVYPDDEYHARKADYKQKAEEMRTMFSGP